MMMVLQGHTLQPSAQPQGLSQRSRQAQTLAITKGCSRSAHRVLMRARAMLPRCRLNSEEGTGARGWLADHGVGVDLFAEEA